MNTLGAVIKNLESKWNDRFTHSKDALAQCVKDGKVIHREKLSDRASSPMSKDLYSTHRANANAAMCVLDDLKKILNASGE